MSWLHEEVMHASATPRATVSTGRLNDMRDLGVGMTVPVSARRLETAIYAEEATHKLNGQHRRPQQCVVKHIGLSKSLEKLMAIHCSQTKNNPGRPGHALPPELWGGRESVVDKLRNSSTLLVWTGHSLCNQTSDQILSASHLRYHHHHNTTLLSPMAMGELQSGRSGSHWKP